MLSAQQSTLLRDGAKLLDIKLTEVQRSQIETYLEELQRWAKITDLVSQSDPEVIIRKHILDSLAALAVLPKSGRLLDLGSGAGFPGLPIAIALPSLSVTLLEPRRKRVNFLKEVIRKTDLTNVRAYEGRAEEVATQEDWQMAFDVVITRATWSLKGLLAIASGFMKRGGMLIAMKGSRAQEELESLSIEPWKEEFCLRTRYNYHLPYGKEERTIFTFRKTRST